MELEEKETKEMEGYNYIKASSYSLMVDERFIYKNKISIYLNEKGIGNILDIDGIGL